jgi:hypothetical protein
MQKRFYLTLLFLLASRVVNADFVYADVIYNDPVTWLSAISGQVMTVNFEGLAPGGSYRYIGSGPGANTSVNGVNFAVGPNSNGNLFIIGDDFYYPGTAAISSQGSSTAFNELLITLPGPSKALGFYFGDFGGDTATITLSDDTVALPTAIVVPYLGFFGVTTWDSGTEINSVDISTPNVVMNVSSLSYSSSVPEPTSLTLLGVALVFMGVVLCKGSCNVSPVPHSFAINRRKVHGCKQKI